MIVVFDSIVSNIICLGAIKRVNTTMVYMPKTEMRLLLFYSSRNATLLFEECLMWAFFCRWFALLHFLRGFSIHFFYIPGMVAFYLYKNYGGFLKR